METEEEGNRMDIEQKGTIKKTIYHVVVTKRKVCRQLKVRDTEQREMESYGLRDISNNIAIQTIDDDNYYDYYFYDYYDNE